MIFAVVPIKHRAETFMTLHDRGRCCKPFQVSFDIKSVQIQPGERSKDVIYFHRFNIMLRERLSVSSLVVALISPVSDNFLSCIITYHFLIETLCTMCEDLWNLANKHGESCRAKSKQLQFYISQWLNTIFQRLLYSLCMRKPKYRFSGRVYRTYFCSILQVDLSSLIEEDKRKWTQQQNLLNQIKAVYLKTFFNW